ncbi:MAG: hypothetical protein WDN24_15940 [Sphingomonas sp.]
MAGYRVKGLGWFICCMVVAPACYAVTSYGAAERAKLNTVDAQIRAAEKEIVGLETEFASRASQAQLEKWNGEALGMGAPQAAQYIAGDAQLADLGGPAAGGQPATAVAAVVPAAAAQPVVAVASRDNAPVRTGAAVARNDGELGKVRTQAVAMLDADLLTELKRLAASEKQKLH